MENLWGKVSRGFFLVLLLIGNPSSCAEVSGRQDSFSGVLIKVLDGDSFVVQNGTEKRAVRLYGIDAPEWDQNYGRKARAHVLTYLHQPVQCRVVDGKDRYGRDLCLVYVGGKLLNEELIEEGFAWWWRRNCKQQICSRWEELQKEASRKKVGLWKEANPEPPWEYRQRRMGRPAKGSQTSSPEFARYRGNISSRVFHGQGCPHARCSQCLETFSSRTEAVQKGFKPCGICRP